MTTQCDIFISYRRLDSATFSQWLATQLDAAYGENTTFIDTQNIRTADAWAEQIESRLNAASVLILVVGKNWLSISDEYGRRRLDLPDDWVRREIETALRTGKKIVPLLIEGAALPAREALPPSLSPLLDIQARSVDMDAIQRGISSLVKEIGALLGKTPITIDVTYPLPLLKIKALDEKNLEVLRERLPTWQVISRIDDGKNKTELMRKYEFKSFRDAIHFMNTAARFIDQKNHHPEWTNIWRTLIVRLTTWDIGSRPSMEDVDMAAYLDDLYRVYTPKIRQRDIDDILPAKKV
jgi:pterin-4a-carbinolamine dehydratase